MQSSRDSLAHLGWMHIGSLYKTVEVDEDMMKIKNVDADEAAKERVKESFRQAAQENPIQRSPEARATSKCEKKIRALEDRDVYSVQRILMFCVMFPGLCDFPTQTAKKLASRA